MTNAQFNVGVDFAIEQCVDLKKHGVPGIHFYVLNRSTACEQILAAMGRTKTVRNHSC